MTGKKIRVLFLSKTFHFQIRFFFRFDNDKFEMNEFYFFQREKQRRLRKIQKFKVNIRMMMSPMMTLFLIQSNYISDGHF